MDLSANASTPAIDAATRWATWRWPGGSTPSSPSCRCRRRSGARYRALARRYARSRVGAPPAPAFPRVPAAARRATRTSGAQDLVEWELDGDPVAVLAPAVAETADRADFSRLALRALLAVRAIPGSRRRTRGRAELALAVGRVQVYEVLRPLERLFEHAAAEVRAAVMRGAAKVLPRALRPRAQGAGRPGAVGRRCGAALLRTTISWRRCRR